MARRTAPIAILGALLVALWTTPGSAIVNGISDLGGHPNVGHLVAGNASVIRTVLSLPEGNLPEGIAVHPSGDVFVSNTIVAGATAINQILRIRRNGETVVFATLPDSTPAVPGVLGLAVDPAGNVYAALASFDPASQGVWRVSRDGEAIERLPGSGDIVFPNALAFDRRGALYVTDSSGAIWRAARGEAFVKWIEDPLLAPLPIDPLGVELPGANGIAFSPPHTLHVANTEQGLIARVRIAPDGSPGIVEAMTAFFAVPTVDGLAVDVHGQIYGVLPAASLLGVSPLVRVDPATGVVTDIVDADEASLFDVPLSVAFAGGPWGVKTVLVVNGALPEVPGDAGPSVVQVAVGNPGSPARASLSRFSLYSVRSASTGSTEAARRAGK